MFLSLYILLLHCLHSLLSSLLSPLLTHTLTHLFIFFYSYFYSRLKVKITISPLVLLQKFIRLCCSLAACLLLTKVFGSAFSISSHVSHFRSSYISTSCQLIETVCVGKERGCTIYRRPLLDGLHSGQQ